MFRSKYDTIKYYIYYAPKRFISEIPANYKNWKMKRKYGYCWIDVWNFDMEFGRKLFYMLKDNNKKEKHINNTIIRENFMWILDHILELSIIQKGIYPTFNQASYSDINSLYEIKSRILSTYGSLLYKVLTEKQLKELGLYGFNVLDRWLSSTVSGYPSKSHTHKSWCAFLRRSRSMFKDMSEGKQISEKKLYNFFKYLPDMWD
jgi:hypothetical protein